MAIKFIDVNYKDIFNNLNFEIRNKQITSIVGKSGSGKTSLMNLIFGLDLNFEGKITVNKRNIESKTKQKQLEIIRKDIFYIWQDYYKQLFNVNVLEDMRYGVSKLDSNKLEELLKAFNLNNEILTKNYFELSAGEVQKILIITMFIRDNKIILLDDPTSNLDQKSVSTLIKLLKKEKRNGKIIIVISQDSEFLLNITDRIIALDNGNIIEQDNKYDFFCSQVVLDKCGLVMPNTLQFRENVLKTKNIKLIYRENISDLIKDIYRNAK